MLDLAVVASNQGARLDPQALLVAFQVIVRDGNLYHCDRDLVAVIGVPSPTAPRAHDLCFGTESVIAARTSPASRSAPDYLMRGPSVGFPTKVCLSPNENPARIPNG